VTWGDCTFDGTNTNCTLSGTFTGLGPGGNYSFVLSYPGNGQSPLTAITQPGSQLFTLSLSAGSLTFNFNESNGTNYSFPSLNFNVFYVPALTSCTGSPNPCGPGGVGSLAMSTITGPVTGSFDLTPAIQAVISASAYGAFPSIAPATWIEIYGRNLALTTKIWSGADFHGNDAPTALGGTTVSVNGQSAFVYYVSPGQVNVQVPSSGVPTGSQPVVVTTDAGSSDPHNVNVNSTEPGLLAPPQFVINGTQYVVALFNDGFYALPPGTGGVAARRAKPGDEIVLFGIGFGPVTPAISAGIIEQDLNNINADVKFSIGGVSAKVDYAGLVATFVGLYQFNVEVPDIPASDTTPLTFTLGGVAGTQKLSLFVGN